MTMPPRIDESPMPSWIDRLWPGRFRSWLLLDRSGWFYAGQRDGQFPVCACHIDGTGDELLRPCAMHKEYIEVEKRKIAERIMKAIYN